MIGVVVGVSSAVADLVGRRRRHRRGPRSGGGAATGGVVASADGAPAGRWLTDEHRRHARDDRGEDDGSDAVAAGAHGRTS